jgi:hypothetical protein
MVSNAARLPAVAICTVVARRIASKISKLADVSAA